MKKLLLATAYLFVSVTLFAQGNSDVFNREDYMSGCLESAQGLPNISAEDYCNCTYEKLLAQLTTSEINDFLTFLTPDKNQDDVMAYLMSKPKIMKIITECLQPQNNAAGNSTGAASSGNDNGFADFSDKEMKTIQKEFKKECMKGLKENPVSKDFNNKLYCDCAWDKIIRTENALDYLNNIDSEASKNLIQQVAVQCVAEQLGKE